jgi:uncharacterized protein YbjT (DUF2867 family)
MKRILVFGATGRTGGLAVDYALSPSKGLEVVALVRDAKKLAPRPGLTIVEGTPANLSDVQRAIPGCEAVLSFLSPSKGDNIFSSRAVAPNLLTLVATNAVTAMKTHGVKRIVVLSALGVGDSAPLLPAAAQWFVGKTNLKQIFADHANEEAMLEAADVDWTSVRAALLIGNKLTRTRISIDGKPKPNNTISRRTTATFMIDCLLHPEFYRRALVASAE